MREMPMHDALSFDLIYSLRSKIYYLLLFICVVYMRCLKNDALFNISSHDRV